MYEKDELLYTQEDIDEWMRTCENLQDHIEEQEEEIEELNKKWLEAIKDWKGIIAEKDKEIEKLNLMIKTLPKHDIEIEQLIRKQVCDEIRTYDRTTNKQKVSYTEYVMGLCEFLDQIEKGEKDE